jgi:sulfite oxidase
LVGVSLVDVLRAAGADADPARHVAFDACDSVERQAQFGVSIPMANALCPDVLLAFEMNGEHLTLAHGFPLRAVVPGFAGVRSSKWITGITVQDVPSGNSIQQHDY